MRVPLRLAGLTLTAVLLLTACGKQTDGTASTQAGATTSSSKSISTSTSSTTTSTSKTSTSSSSSSSSSSTETSTTSDDPTTETTDAPATVQEAKFGDTFAYDDGLKVAIGAPTAFTPSEYAAADPAPAYAAFPVIITNNTGKTYDPSSFYVTGISGDKEIQSVYDSEQNLNGAPSTGILDGRDATFMLGYGVNSLDDVVLQVSPSFDYTEVFFTSSGTQSSGGTAAAPAGTIVKESDADRAKFTEYYQWDTGLLVTASAGTPFTPSEYASADPANAYLSFTVTIINNTGALYDPSLFFVNAQSGSADADQVYDSANGYYGSPTTGLLPGRSLTFQLGYGVTDANDVVLEVTPGFDYSDAYFTS